VAVEPLFELGAIENYETFSEAPMWNAIAGDQRINRIFAETRNFCRKRVASA
jgi:hypothetical protein